MKQIALCLKQKVKKGYENDRSVLNGYKTIATIKGGGYKRLSKLAAEYSKQLGSTIVSYQQNSYYFFECDALERGLAAVCIETLFTLTEDHGSGVVCDYFVSGEHVNTIVEDAQYHLEELQKEKEFGSMRKIVEKLHVLQKKLLAYSFNIDYRFDDKGDVFIVVSVFMKSDSNPQSFAFYNFRSVEGNMREYQYLVDLLEGRVEQREELDIF